MFPWPGALDDRIILNTLKTKVTIDGLDTSDIVFGFAGKLSSHRLFSLIWDRSSKVPTILCLANPTVTSTYCGPMPLDADLMHPPLQCAASQASSSGTTNKVLTLA